LGLLSRPSTASENTTGLLALSEVIRRRAWKLAKAATAAATTSATAAIATASPAAEKGAGGAVATATAPEQDEDDRGEAVVHDDYMGIYEPGEELAAAASAATAIGDKVVFLDGERDAAHEYSGEEDAEMATETSLPHQDNLRQTEPAAGFDVEMPGLLGEHGSAREDSGEEVDETRRNKRHPTAERKETSSGLQFISSGDGRYVCCFHQF
jgi:hypothetical protein